MGRLYAIGNKLVVIGNRFIQSLSTLTLLNDNSEILLNDNSEELETDNIRNSWEN